jgi:hypothetical protein
LKALVRVKQPEEEVEEEEEIFRLEGSGRMEVIQTNLLPG